MTRVRNHVLPSKGCLAGLCLVYAVTMLYSSTIIGPTGVNFVYRDPVEAFWFFLGTPYVAHGSDQRADWMGNLLMLVPFGFLVTGLVWPRRAVARLPAALCAILICIAAGGSCSPCISMPRSKFGPTSSRIAFTFSTKPSM